jgi:hypothetical protein
MLVDTKNLNHWTCNGEEVFVDVRNHCAPDQTECYIKDGKGGCVRVDKGDALRIIPALKAAFEISDEDIQ